MSGEHERRTQSAERRAQSRRGEAVVGGKQTLGLLPSYHCFARNEAPMNAGRGEHEHRAENAAEL